MNPIVRRELLELLRSRKAMILQVGLAAACAVLVLLRWPTGDVVELDGARSLQVLRVFGYGMFAGILLIVPAFPATSVVREKMQGSLALLLNSPLPPRSIYLGKLQGVLGFTLALLIMTLPAAGACYALGGLDTEGGILMLYAVLFIAALQFAALGLLVSTRSRSLDGAMRATYALVLAVTLGVLVPDALTRGTSGLVADLMSWLRCLSPVPALMYVLGQGDIGTHGMGATYNPFTRYVILAGAFSLACAVATIASLNHKLFDRARSAGVMSNDLALGGQIFRRLFFLIDPQRRSGSMSLWLNPVMVKEFRSRRFGRAHWMLRLIGGSAILSLALGYVALINALGWGVDIIGGGLGLLQVTLLVLFSPSLAAGLISSERETGSWQLLRMTPLSPAKIVIGKLLSVLWPLLLLLLATLPGYVIMMTFNRNLIHQIERVMVCLSLTALFTLAVSATVGSFFRKTALAMTASYVALLAICVGPLLIWLAREAPFGHNTVETALLLSPVAGMLQASEMPGFAGYALLPANWWIVGATTVTLLIVLGFRTWQLSRPE